MNLDELIKHLQRLKAEHGKVPVKVRDYFGEENMLAERLLIEDGQLIIEGGTGP